MPTIVTRVLLPVALAVAGLMLGTTNLILQGELSMTNTNDIMTIAYIHTNAVDEIYINDGMSILVEPEDLATLVKTGDFSDWSGMYRDWTDRAEFVNEIVDIAIEEGGALVAHYNIDGELVIDDEKLWAERLNFLVRVRDYLHDTTWLREHIIDTPIDKAIHYDWQDCFPVVNNEGVVVDIVDSDNKPQINPSLEIEFDDVREYFKVK